MRRIPYLHNYDTAYLHRQFMEVVLGAEGGEEEKK
jgi:hypothetical protein